MPSVRQIRRRIRSVENTAKITKAMSMIAASKMRRAQESALTGRPYADRLHELLADLAAQPHDDPDTVHPLLRRREPRNVEIVHITPDRGLTGGLNSNVNRSAAQFIVGQDGTASVVAVGKSAWISLADRLMTRTPATTSRPHPAATLRRAAARPARG